LTHHLELAVTTAARDRLLEQEQRGYTEEDFSVIARKYFPEVVFPTIEQDLELFEKPPPIEPAATISSMGEVAASVQQDVNLESLPLEPAPQQPTEPMAEQFAAAQSTDESPAGTEPNQPQTPGQEVASSESATEPQPDQSGVSHSPMNLLAKLIRGESARPDGS
jgi:hypothetical protein